MQIDDRLCSTLSLEQDLEFHGVMRFYFQDRVAGNFATKCIRVSSTATTQDVIETLAEKFRPDMRMLSSPKYSLYEVHVSGGESPTKRREKEIYFHNQTKIILITYVLVLQRIILSWLSGEIVCLCVCVLEERQLDLDEKPLVVQLNWNKDDREGRFVLKNENDILPKVSCFAD